MRLAAAASYFDKLPIYDAYSGSELFSAQLDVFDDSKRDAPGGLRRILSLAPGLPLPVRHAIEAPKGEFWIMGARGNSDVFYDQVIREKYVVQRAEGLAFIRTPAQVIAATGGTPAYAGLAWTKDWKEQAYTSKVFAYYELYFAQGETVDPGLLVELSGKILRVRSTYLSEAGFLVAESDDLPAARVTVTYKATTAFDPVADTKTENTLTVTALKLPFIVDFEYRLESSLKRQEGDFVALVSKADVTAAVGDTLAVDGSTFKVVAVVSEMDAWRVHAHP